jgi:uncharacterized protein involved in type VI secretion and phage assembly
MAETGVVRALVVANIDPKGAGRIGVRIPGHARSDEVHWAPLAAPMAGRGRGVWFRPEVGDEVLVAFEHAEPARPLVIGALWSGSVPPPEAGHDLRMIRTRSGHTLVFDDGPDGRVELALGDGKRLSIDEGTVRLVDQHGNGMTIESGSGSVTVQAAGELRLRASRISIESTGPTTIKSSATLTLAGSLVRIN